MFCFFPSEETESLCLNSPPPSLNVPRKFVGEDLEGSEDTELKSPYHGHVDKFWDNSNKKCPRYYGYGYGHGHGHRNGRKNSNSPYYHHINSLVAKYYSSFACPLRSNSHHGNATLHDYVENMIPFPKLHFMSEGFQPLLSSSENNVMFKKHRIKNLTKKCFDYGQWMTSLDSHGMHR